MKTDLKGKIAVVTGAGSGLGRTVALRLAARGAGVVIVGRNAGRLNETQRMIESRRGSAHVFPADTSNAAAVEKLAVQVEKSLGKSAHMANAPAAPVMIEAENCAAEKDLAPELLASWAPVIS